MNNTKSRDNGGRLIFENATLCSQFLREYTGMDLFKDIEPGDVEDMTERYLPMFAEERDSDVVKKIRLHGTADDSGFSELFVVALIEHKSSVDYNVSMQFPDNYLEDIAGKTTGDVLIVLAKLIESYLRNINLPDDEIYELTDKIKEGDMNRLFEHFEGYDIQKVRSDSRTEGREEGREEGEDIHLITQIHKKLKKGKTPEVIADEVEESVDTVRDVIAAIAFVGEENFDEESVLDAWKCRTPEVSSMQ